MHCDSPAKAFLDLPIETDLDNVNSTFAVIGAPYGVPYSPKLMHSDCSNGPDAIRLRSHRYGRQLEHYDFDLNGTLFGDTGATAVDCGNIPGTLDIGENTQSVVNAIRTLVQRGVIPIVLAGDDSVPPWCLQAFEKHGPLNVLQIDSHLDFRDEVNGEHHGYSSAIRRISEYPWIKKIVQLGARGSGSARPQDLEDALEAGNIIIPAEVLHDEGISAVTQHLTNDAPWFVTLDIDGLDPSIAPATGAPLPGGISFHQMRKIFHYLCTHTELRGIDVVEYFPALDINDTTALTITRLLTNVLGITARNKSALAWGQRCRGT